MGITSVRLQPDIEDGLATVASNLHRSKSWIINQAVKEFLEKQITDQQMETAHFRFPYNTPTSKYNIKAEGKPYISVWDGLEYIRFTDLGKFVLGLSAEYTPIEIQQNKTKLKFDEYSPIITVDAKDGVTIAKLEGYADKIDANKYILSYSKIFKD